MKVLVEGALDKNVMVPENQQELKKTRKTIYEVPVEKYLEKIHMKLPKEFILKCKKFFNEPNFIPVELKI